MKENMGKKRACLKERMSSEVTYVMYSPSLTSTHTHAHIYHWQGYK